MPYFDPGPISVLPGTFTVDTLPTPGASTLDLYARVSDLFGEKRGLVVCSQSNTDYYWEPVRPSWANRNPISVASTDMTLFPLKTPTVLNLTGVLAGNRNINVSKVGAYPGAWFDIAFNGTLNLFGLNISGLVGGSTLSMVLGGRRRIFFDGAEWQQFQ